MIRCPVCATVAPPATVVEDFAARHQECKGQTFDCACGWERLCDGMTILARTSDLCPACVAASVPEESVRRCPGCRECKPS